MGVHIAVSDCMSIIIIIIIITLIKVMFAHSYSENSRERASESNML